MKLMLAFFTVISTVLATSSLISITLVTYGLRPHGSRLLSLLAMFIWIAVASACLYGATSKLPAPTPKTKG